ncbi:MAG: signal peptidase II [Anaerolineae bacterium]
MTLSKLQRLALIGAIVLLCVVSDRTTKELAQRLLSQSEPRVLLGGMLTLTYAVNHGAFLGLGGSLPSPLRFALSLLSNAVIIAWGLILILRTASIETPKLVSVALLVGGGIGNLIDRIGHDGGVVDFMVLRAGPLHTGIFNVADLAIVGGALALGALAFWEGKQVQTQEKQPPDQEDDAGRSQGEKGP